MTPGKWIFEKPEKDWYDYKNSKWANIVTEFNGAETYFIWIPRYCFKLDNEKQRSDVKLISVKNSWRDPYAEDEENNTTTWEELQAQGYQIPDAFTFDGKALPGFWAMKYNMGETPEDASIIEYDMITKSGTITLTNTKITNPPEEVAKCVVYLNGKEKYTITNKSEIAEINRKEFKLKGLRKGDNVVNITALNSKDEMVGSRTKIYATADVNEPDLSGFQQIADTTYYVTYDEEGNENSTIPISSEEPEGWYDYSSSEWANIVVRNNGGEIYYTWIPRYEFTLDTTNQRSTVKFIKGTSTTPTAGYQIPDAFTFNKKELTGFWAMKYNLGDEERQIFGVGGDGSTQNPYLISTAYDLKRIAYRPTANYKLVNDIDLSEEDWVPIGDAERPFTGEFNGNGYTISNMKVNAKTDQAGLFGYIAGAKIHDLTLQDFNIKTTASCAGGLAGYSEHSSIITNVNAVGNIYYGKESVYIGGLVGLLETVENSSTISRCYTEGNIRYDNKDSTYTSYGGEVGGLVGRIGSNEDGKYVNIENSYSSMSILANDCVGGLAGVAGGYAKITNSYAVGAIKAEGAQGGIVGALDGGEWSAINTYWIKETTGQNTSELGIPKSVSSLTKQETYTGWDFANIWTIEEGESLAYLQGRVVPDAIYNIVESYPVMGGSGTKDNPLIITSAEQLNKMRQDLSSYYKLGANIDVSSISNWEPIGTEEDPFTGTLEGNGYTISNLKISNTSRDFIGLFGYTQNATIQNFTLQNYTISSTKNYIGSLVGVAQRTNITNINAIGNICYGRESGYIGGLVGLYATSGAGSTLSKCYTEGNIRFSYNNSTSTSYGGEVGGLVGRIGSDEEKKYVNIENSYSSMSIMANDCVGGLAGVVASYVRISNSYAVGEVKAAGTQGGIVGGIDGDNYSATNTYWIKETTGQTASELGMAKTVSTLTKQESYTNWDFANIWTIEEGQSLAYLQGRAVPDAIYNIVENYPVMGGTGTDKNPLIITSAEQLNKMRQDLTAHYKLGANIDLSSISNWEPIGTEEEPFTGTLEGNGYTISNLKISSSSRDGVGLFGYTLNATIQNLTLQNYTISLNRSAIGALVGYAMKTNITNVNTIGNIYYNRDSAFVGGIAGVYETETSDVYISKCYSEGDIRYSSASQTTSSYGSVIGGIAGQVAGELGRYNGRAYVTNSYSTMTVIGNNNIGGLVGRVRRKS